ncbi:MAG: protein kinase, partial [Pyrinomonadaceae bacterium]
GEVYLADDTELERPVAIKLLPADVASKGQRMQRFVQEAKVASALNHPNIVTVHEIGEAPGGARFIATEYVRGETLRQRAARERLPLGEAFDVAVQIASALAAAHEARVVHRDIKPENVMLRPDGLVKVLDFGLAKLTERRREEATDGEAPTRALVNTAPGVVMGTFAYMSPEQARGQETDERTDIWSFGVVLYEMLTGVSPFAGETQSDTVAAVLRSEPAPLAAFAPDAPAELQRIVRKCLQKSRDERYQTVKDLRLDLKTLKRELELAGALEHGVTHAPPQPAFTAGASRSGVGADTGMGDGAHGASASGAGGVGMSADANTSATARAPVASPTHGQQARETAGTSEASGGIKRRKGGAAVVAAVALVAVAALGVGVYLFAGRRAPAARFAKLRFTRLTTTGRVKEAAVSPDGRYVVYVNDEGGRQGLWLKQIATAQNVQIVTPSDALLAAPVFTPDGNYVCYLQSTDGGVTHTLYRVAVLGGDARKLVFDVDNRVAFSPDGKRVAFIRNSTTESNVMIADADGTNERRLATHTTGEPFFHLAWSPDGKVIACTFSRGTGNNALASISVDGGAEQPLGAQRWQRIANPAWLPDGSAVVMTAADTRSEQSQVWMINYPSGEARQLTNDLSGYRGGSVTADGRSLVVLHTDLQANLWIAPTAKPDDARRVTNGAGRNDGASGLSWTPDGRVVFTSNAGGAGEVWTTDQAGGDQKQLTASAGVNSYPTATADGRYVVFLSQRAGAPALYRMDADGGNPTQLAAGEISFQSASSPDGKWIVYTTRLADSDRANLWKISVEGGAPARLTEENSSLPAISPDGKLIAYRAVTDEPYAPSPRTLKVVPSDGGAATKLCDLPLLPYRVLQWTPDGRFVAFLDRRGGFSNVWVAPAQGGQPRQLTHFTSDGVFYFAFSRDGKWIALSRGEETSDAVLVSEDR